jgi:hypothetical protein
MPARKRRPEIEAPKGALLVPLGHHPDGSPITVTERVATALRLGASYQTAAARAGVANPTLHSWLRAGARHASALATGARLESELTDQERAELAFATAVGEAEADHELALLTQLEHLSHPRHAITVTERTGPDGAVDRTERVEAVDPDGATVRWRLERRFPDTWGRREAIAIDARLVADVDVTERAAELVAQLRAGGALPPGG